MNSGNSDYNEENRDVKSLIYHVYFGHLIVKLNSDREWKWAHFDTLGWHNIFCKDPLIFQSEKEQFRLAYLSIAVMTHKNAMDSATHNAHKLLVKIPRMSYNEPTTKFSWLKGVEV